MNDFPAPPTMNMPNTPSSPPTPPPPAGTPWSSSRERRGERNGALVFGILLVVVGGWLLLRQYFPIFEWDQLWPVLLIGLGVLLVVSAFWRRAA